MIKEKHRVRRVAALALTAALGAILIGYRLGSHPLWDPDEAKHAEVAREMLVEGRLVEPIVNFQPYHHKPSALYLAIGAAYRVFGVSAFGARFVPALLAWLTLLAVCAHGARRSAGEGLLAALLLGACGLFVMVGRFTNFDAPLTFFLTSAVLALARMVETPTRRDALWLFASVGLAALVKGPAAIALILVPLVLAVRRGDLHVADLSIGAGLALLGAILATWTVPALITAPHYLEEFLWVHNVERYLAPVGADVFHPQPFWFFVPVLLGALLPWSLWIPAAVAQVFTGPADRGARVLADFSLWVVIFFSLSSGKLATYILPAVPSLALVTAAWLMARRDDPRAGRSAGKVAASISALSWPAAYLYLRIVAPELASYASVLVPLSVAGVIVAARRSRSSLQSAVVLSTGFCASLIAFNVFAAAAVSPWSSDADLAAKALQLGRPQRVIAYRVRPFSFLFYTGWPMQYHVPLDEVREALYQPGGALLLTEDPSLLHLEEAAPGVEFKEVARNPRHVLYEVRSPWG